MLNDFIKNGSTSVIFRGYLYSSVDGSGLTGLTSASTGMIISTITDNEATATTYTVAAGNVETIATLATYAAPTASKCRFKEVDATNHPGLYEFQFADARYAVSSAKKLYISVSGATNLLDADFTIYQDLMDASAVNAECDTALTDYDPPTNAEMEARTLVAANYATSATQTLLENATYMTAGTADSGSTTTMTDAVLTEADTDHWKGALIKFTSGNASGQVRRITGFDPATDTVTFAPAVTSAVGSSDGYYLLPGAAVGALVGDAASDLLTTQMTESYAADGVAPTLAQSLFLLLQSIHEFEISGTTRTVKRLDGSTTAATFTLNSATKPTSTTRAS